MAKIIVSLDDNLIKVVPLNKDRMTLLSGTTLIRLSSKLTIIFAMSPYFTNRSIGFELLKYVTSLAD